jgi:hypothetical protein
MCAVAVVVVGIVLQHAGEVGLVENDDVIEAFAPDRADQALWPWPFYQGEAWILGLPMQPNR